MLAKLKLTSQTEFDPGVETDEQLWSLIKKLVKIFSKHNDQKVSVEFSKLFFNLHYCWLFAWDAHLLPDPSPLDGNTAVWNYFGITALACTAVLRLEQLNSSQCCLNNDCAITLQTIHSVSTTENYFQVSKPNLWLQQNRQNDPFLLFSRLVLLPELFGIFFK